MAEVKQALTYLEMLVAPSTEPTEPANQRQNFDRLLQRNLDRLQSVLDKESAEIRPLATSVQAGEDVRWVYVEWLLRLLNHLHDVLRAAVEAAKLIPPSEPLTPGRAPPLAPDTLSLGQQKTLRTCLQFITFLGLCPHLSPGVGLPPERRSGFSSALGESPSFSPKDRLNRLAVCTETLLHCARLPALGSLIFSRHLGDLLAALAEIGHSPSSAQLDQSAPVPGGRTHFRQELDRLLDQVYLPAVVRELLLLQGSPQKVSLRCSLLSHPVKRHSCLAGWSTAMRTCVAASPMRPFTLPLRHEAQWRPADPSRHSTANPGQRLAPPHFCPLPLLTSNLCLQATLTGRGVMLLPKSLLAAHAPPSPQCSITAELALRSVTLTSTCTHILPKQRSHSVQISPGPGSGFAVHAGCVGRRAVHPCSRQHRGRCGYNASPAGSATPATPPAPPAALLFQRP